MSEQKDSQFITGPGKVLAEGREALDLSREQTADVLNLSVRVIRAIEESDPEKLPDSVYVNGYIRSYAKLLGLAAQPLIDAWWAHHAKSQNRADVEELLPEPTDRSLSQQPLKMGRWAALALLLSVVFVFFVTGRDADPASEDQAAAAAQEQAQEQNAAATSNQEESGARELVVSKETANEPQVDSTESQVAESAPVEVQTTATATDIVQSNSLDSAGGRGSDAGVPVAGNDLVVEQRQDIADAKNEIASAEDNNADIPVAKVTPAKSPSQDDTPVAPAREAAAAFNLPRLTEFGDDEIRLSFKADCWFEIRNSTGMLLYADLGRAEQTRRYVGAGPFRIKIGFSPGAELTYNGTMIDLQPYSRLDVATVLVGANPQSR